MSVQATANPFFTPTQISGCQLWLDAADRTSLVVSGSNVSLWRDKSGQGRNATAQVAATYVQNTLSFTGSNYYSFNNFSFAVGGYFSLFLVERLQSSTGELTILGTDTTGTNQGLHIRYNGVPGTTNATGFRFGFFNNDLDATNIPAFTTAAAQPTRIWSLVFTNSFRGIYLYGTLMVSDGNNTPLTSWNTPLLGRAFVSLNPTLFYYNGFISEIIGYGGQITTATRQQVEGYLAWKWGLQANLPASHPYKTSPISPLLNPPTSLPALNTNSFFAPTQISGCTLWLDSVDPSTLTVSGTGITRWTDKSSTRAVFNASSISPTLSAPLYNGNRAMFFNGSSFFQNTSFVYTTSSRSAFFVYDETVEQNNRGILAFASSGTDFNQLNTMAYETGFKTSQYLQIVQAFGNGGYALQIQTTSIGFALYSDTFGSGRETAYVNGSQTATTTSGAAFTNSTGLVLGGRMSGGTVNNLLIGVIGEVILFNRPLSTSERQQVEGYLAWKWGLQANLPASHPSKTSPIPPLLSPPLSAPRIMFAGWQPNQLSGLSLWLDAADSSTITLSGSGVTQWNDKAGLTNVTQSSASLRPTYQATAFNGRPTLRFTGVQGSSYQELASGTTNQYDSLTALYVFIVYRVITPAPGFPSPFSIQNKVAFYLRGLDNTNNFTGTNPWTFNGSSFVANNDTTVTYDQNGFLCLGLDNSLQSLFLNGSFSGAPKAFAFGTGTSLIVRIGYSGYNTNDGFNGFISEVLTYKASLSTLQRQTVEGYLAWKWGLVSNLPAAHPFKNWPPAP